MEKLFLYNTLARKKEEFKPLKDKVVTFYQCGPTVYWTQHIGNMRAMVLADLMVRSLDYLGYKVKFVRNYTDVGHLTSDQDLGEDKLEKGARREGKTPEEIAAKYTKVFEQDVKDLNVLEPWKKPVATKHIKEMIKMVQMLLDNGYAYQTDLAVYFDVSKAKNYNQLSGQDLEKNISDAGKGEVSDPAKKHPADFALWFFKAGVHKNALQTWPSPFNSALVKDGEGFPGWHIECSAMSQKYLGDTLDIHMGGIEHIPVHHTNEIAQSEAASGKKFVNYWLHNEHLTVDGGKMSKSAGTSYSLQEIRDKDFDPLVLRYFFLQAHYRSKQNFTWPALQSASNALVQLQNEIRLLDGKGKVAKEYQDKFIAALSDDFNIPKALSVVWDLLRSSEKSGDKKATLLDFDQVLGLNLAEVKEVPKEVINLAEQRQKARLSKDWQKADDLRKQIELEGYLVEDANDSFVIKTRK
ncbi:MAG: cysteine--tRNA ligase [Patescibacteria group bacterium]|jgi:cysteinyl-tRNA synthetase